MDISKKKFEILCKDILLVLRAWKSAKPVECSLLPRLLITKQVKQSHIGLDEVEQAKVLIQTAWDELDQTHPESATLLRQRFIEKSTHLKIALLTSSSEDRIKKNQKKAIEHLGEILSRREVKRRNLFLEEIEDELDFRSYNNLFGMDIILEQLEKLMRNQDEAPWVIGITGIGGSGKTSIVNETFRRIVATFTYDFVAWVSLSQTLINAEDFSDTIIEALHSRFIGDLSGTSGEIGEKQTELFRFFNQNRCLVVIDNLELPKEISSIVPLLNRWMNPTKFILTARSWSPEIDLALQIRLEDLEEEPAFKLFEEQAKLRGSVLQDQFSRDRFNQLYQLVGGNPLMIKLSVGLLEVYPFQEVLNDLKNGMTQKTEWKYRYIYSKLWASLNEEAKQLLEAMPLVGRSGGGIPQLVAISQLSLKDTLDAIGTLVNRCLLELKGSTENRRYGIHPLTHTFVATEIISLPNAFIMDRDKYLD